MASSPTPLEQIFGWATLALGILAIVLFGAWPHIAPSSEPEATAPTRIVIDADTANSLRRAGILLGTGNRLEQLADDPLRLDQAEKLIVQLLEQHPNLAEAHRLDGLLSLTRGEITTAQAAFERCLKVDPRNLPALLALGASYAETDDHQTAEEIFRRASESHPESAAALNNLGQTLWLLGREDEALEVYRRKIEIQQRSSSMSVQTTSAESTSAPSTSAESGLSTPDDNPNGLPDA